MQGDLTTAQDHVRRGNFPAAAQICTALRVRGVDPQAVATLAAEIAQPWRAAAVQANDHDSRFQLAAFLQSVDQAAAARAELDAIEQAVPAVLGSAHFHTLRGLCERTLGHAALAADAFRSAADRASDPATKARALRRLAASLAASHRVEAAWDASAHADALIAPDVESLFADLMLLPVTYANQAQVDRVRARFTERLGRLRDRIDLSTAEACRAAVAAIRSPYYLHYQGGPDLPHQSAYGGLVHDILAAWRPDLTARLPMPAIDGPLRVGFASYMLHTHSVTKLFGCWAFGLDPSAFAVHAYHLGPRKDAMTDAFRDHCASYVDLAGAPVDAMCERIRADRLHVLIFPEIGMSATTLQLAGLRSAPVQCMAWGHPVTSGLPTVDAMLSSAAMEPEGAEQNYTEQLVRLPGLSITFEPPRATAATKTRADFGLREADFVYLIPQSLQKLLPSADELYPRIAAAVPRARFVFLADANDAVTDAFRTRLTERFVAASQSPDAHLLFLPQLSTPDYLELNRVADVFLDGLSWSGGVTTLEAVHMGLVPLTCPGPWMRARHTAAILNRLGVLETIAEDRKNYVAIAIRLAQDLRFYEELQARIRTGLPLLQDDPSVLPALASFLNAAVTSRSNS